MKKSYLVWLLICWTIFIIGSLILNISNAVSSNKKLTHDLSRAFFEQIEITREWNSNHNGVYIPLTIENPPNPYLIDSFRDVVTTNGLKLTKINPAYMTRQIADLHKISDKVQFRITSLKPIRPANKADYWETKALESFEKGVPEVFELVGTDSNSQYRYMAPLLIKKSCLDCHAKQGYKVGNIRGGISVSMLSASYLAIVKKQVVLIFIFHFIVFVIGIIGFGIFYKKTNSYFSIIQEKNTELLKINKTKDKLFSIIAYDLRSPFSSIMGLSELLLKNIQKYDIAESKEILFAINHSANNTFNLLENLLKWAKSQSDQIIFKPEVVKLEPIVDEIADAVMLSAEIKKISINHLISPDIEVYVDTVLLKTILRNLISNAINFTNINGRIDIVSTINQNLVEVAITDDGVGMSEETLNNLFKNDTYYTTTGTSNESGTGLGLILCKEFVEKLGGSIWAESQVKKGSVFKFTIPVSQKA
ncbi:MAG: hypothetical protein A2X11_12545 [Bacteroidetes bacterium GWE2_42_24]|nr:MAG: hypothetical protein A2X11_12545 [Bacteroidetes bacterium GWE2_42_24]OFY30607.1 MAG: hypothetical protein A2X09_03795 [Bacteroidetes bacterium GWF2_43_11]